MKLYSGPLSLFSAKVRVVLAEKNLDYERVDVAFSRAGYEPKHPDVLRLNPKAQVPVLQDGGLDLYDSTIICEYLEDRYPEVPLYPSDAISRARCRQLEASADEVLFPHVWVLINQVFYGGGDQDAIAAAREAIGDHYARIDDALAGREYLCESYSIADIAYFLTVSFAIQLGAAPAAERSNLMGWLARMAAKPVIAAETAAMTRVAASLT